MIRHLRTAPRQTSIVSGTATYLHRLDEVAVPELAGVFLEKRFRTGTPIKKTTERVHHRRIELFDLRLADDLNRPHSWGRAQWYEEGEVTIGVLLDDVGQHPGIGRHRKECRLELPGNVSAGESTRETSQ